jgi:hypothetical protein
MVLGDPVSSWQVFQGLLMVKAMHVAASDPMMLNQEPSGGSNLAGKCPHL